MRALGPDVDALRADWTDAGGSLLRSEYATTIQPIMPTDFDFSLTPEAWLCRAEDVGQVRWYFSEARQTWTIERFGSPALQVVVWPPNDKGLPAGWIQYETGYFHEGRQLSMPDDFRSWADKRIGRVKREFQRDPDSGCYNGPEAAHYLASRQKSA